MTSSYVVVTPSVPTVVPCPTSAVASTSSFSRIAFATTAFNLS